MSGGEKFENGFTLEHLREDLVEVWLLTIDDGANPGG
jgi:hypothetical protein